MEFGKNLFYLLAILATFNFITAQEVSAQDDTDSTPPESSPVRQSQIPFFGSLPNFPNFSSSSGSSSFPGFGSFPGLEFLQAFGFPFSGSSSTNSSDEDVTGRRRRSPEDSDDDTSGVANQNDEDDDENNDDEPHSRLFFSLFNTRLVSCNYTTQAGATCISCRQALNCFSSNVGTLRTCKAYCNNGRCSLFPGTLCSTSSTNSTA